MSTDRIEKTILLHAPMARVWKALSDSTQFGEWFGMKFDGPFQPGTVVNGKLVGTTVDPEVAKSQVKHAHLPFEILIEEMIPEKRFSMRWHPFALDLNVDYSKEPRTLVSFDLEQKADGVLLTVTESGFDQIPIERRAKAFTANDNGWGLMVTMIGKYLDARA